VKDMADQKAWDIFRKEISPQIDATEGLQFKMTAYSNKDWKNGLCIVTNKGDIHILGDGTVVDEKKLLA